MSKQIKRLAEYSDIDVHCDGPFSDVTVQNRHKEYLTLSLNDFKKKYRNYVYRPASITIDGTIHYIDLNRCYNPFCKWFGLEQKKYTSIKSSPSRYNLTGTDDRQAIYCNDVLDNSISGIIAGNYSATLSNWSVGEEIRRLIKVNSVAPLKSKYNFHTSSCANILLNPFDNPDQFYKRGKSTANSQKYQCRECKKLTNVLPTISERFNYNQTLDGILIDFAVDIMCRAPVKKTCEKLKIASKTYYNKLEIVYKRCLEFLEVHETEALKKKHFNEIMINTDFLTYNLNNTKRRRKAKKNRPEEDVDDDDYDIVTDRKKLTYLLASVDVKTGYAFRADIAYDFDFDLNTLKKDSEEYHCNASYNFIRKNQRLAYSYFPFVHRSMNTDEASDCDRMEREIKKRQKYVEGCHTSSPYTALAHYFLLKQMVNSEKWHFVSDDDITIQSGIFRIFRDEILTKNSHYFICSYPKGLTLDDAGKAHFRRRKELEAWAEYRGCKALGIMAKARMYLKEYFDNCELYEYYPGTKIPSKSLGFIVSPLTTKSEGERLIDFKTNVNDINSDELARIVSNVSNNVIDNFFQELRRRVSILERPIVTARGDGKSYIYANFNPKYAQYFVTIFRTLYNFCWTKNTFGKRLTPAQKIGLADKVYTIKDIIYFK